MTPLHQFGESIRQFFLQVPLGVARALFLLFLAAILCWVLTLPRAQTSPSSAPPRLSENLKFWAALSLFLQLLIYALL